jgi:hypothetical protein
MNSEFISWLFIAIVVAIGVVIRSRYKLSKISFDVLSPTLEKELDINLISLSQAKPYLENEKFKIVYYNPILEKMIIDFSDIGFFHWGFFYILHVKDDKLYCGIYAKGPNPPNNKTLEKYLDVFLSRIKPLFSQIK